MERVSPSHHDIHPWAGLLLLPQPFLSSVGNLAIFAVRCAMSKWDGKRSYNAVKCITLLLSDADGIPLGHPSIPHHTDLARIVTRRWARCKKGLGYVFAPTPSWVLWAGIPLGVSLELSKFSISISPRPSNSVCFTWTLVFGPITHRRSPESIH